MIFYSNDQIPVYLPKKVMKKIVMILAMILVATGFSYSQGNLEVTVENIRTTSGNIRVGLFDSEPEFLKKAIIGKVIKATADKVTVVFENIKPGEYGLSVFHDENENGELDSNAIGLPKEGFAFGNNAMGMFGPPSFEKAKVTVSKDKVVRQVLKLKYI
jgi:uncharacterized protein (DUF2141 family)